MKKFSILFALVLTVSFFTSCTQNELQDEVAPTTQNDLQTQSTVIDGNDDEAVDSRAACGPNQCSCTYKVVSLPSTANLQFCGVSDGDDSICTDNASCGPISGGIKTINGSDGSFCLPTGNAVGITNLSATNATIKVTCGQSIAPPTDIVVPGNSKAKFGTTASCGIITNC